MTKQVVLASTEGVMVLAAPQINTSNGGNWLTVPNGLSGDFAVQVTNTATMSPGTYTGTIAIFDDASKASTTLNVRLTIGNPTTGLIAVPSTLTFLQTGPGAGASQKVSLRVSGNRVPIDTFIFTPTTGGIPFVDITGPDQDGFVTVTVNASATANGSYSGNLRLVAQSGVVTVPVSLTIGAGAAVAATPNPVNFTIQVGGTAPSQNISVTANGTPATVSSVSATQSTAFRWLTATIPAQSTGIVNLSIDGTGLAAGVYNETAQITTTQGSITVPVKLTIGGTATMQVSAASLAFAHQFGTSFPASQSVTVTSNGSPLTYSTSVNTSIAGWLTISPLGSQTTPGTITVSVNPTGLAASAAPYTGTIRIDTFDGTPPVDIPVSLVVSNSPVVIANPATLQFTSQTGANPASRLLTITSSSTLLSYTATANVTSPVGGSWLRVTNANGSTTGNVTVEVNTIGLPAGVFRGTVNVASAGSGNGSVAVPVTLTMTTGATFQLSPSTLPFAYQRGQSLPVNRAVTLGLSSGTLGYTAVASTTSGGSWLQVSPTSGTAPGNFIVTVNPNGGGGATALTPGTYNGTITVTPAGSTVVQTIPVTLVVSDTALLTLNPLEITFEANQGTFFLDPKIVAIGSTDSSPITYTVIPSTTGTSWLSVNQPTGPTPSNVIISANPGGLAPGVYTGSVGVFATSPTNVSNSPINIGVTLNIRATATLTASPTSLSVTQLASGGTPDTRQISVTSTGGAVTFNAVSNASWLSVNPSSATTPTTINVTANGSGLAANTYTGTVVISSTGAANTQTVTVTMTVTGSSSSVIAISPTTLAPVNFQIGGANPLPQTLAVSLQGGGSATFNASAVHITGSGWLSVAPGSGTTPGSVTVSVNPSGLAVGSYSGTVSIAASGATTLNLPITLTVSPAVAVTPNIVAVQHGASFLFTSVAPGMGIVIKGSDLGPPTLTTYTIGSNGLFSTTLAETRVLFDGVAAPIYYTSSTQVAVYVPYSVAGRTNTQLVVQYKGVSSAPQTYRVVTSAPGIYTLNATSTAGGDGSGQGAILNQDYSINSSTNPETAGNFIQIYATGEGQTTPAGVDGSISPNRLPLPVPVLPVSVSIGGRTLAASDVVYAGAAPGAIAGHLQVNARIPADLPTGAHPIVIRVGDVASQTGVIVNVRAR